MKERPILFSGPMVRAILEGRKTVTRRPVKPKHIEANFIAPSGWYADRYNHGEAWCLWGSKDTPQRNKCGTDLGKCPYGQPGDRLWVRETFAIYEDEIQSEVGICRADGESPAELQYVRFGKWTPSIHMPRWASRITLEVTGVRVERVREITEEQAKAEGAIVDQDCIQSGGNYRTRFCGTWNSIYPASWDRNDWVWVVEFRRI